MPNFNEQGLANIAWALSTVGIRTPELMQKVSAAASLLLEQFGSVDLLEFLWGYERSGGSDKSWVEAVAPQYMRKYEWTDAQVAHCEVGNLSGDAALRPPTTVRVQGAF